MPDPGDFMEYQRLSDQSQADYHRNERERARSERLSPRRKLWNSVVLLAFAYLFLWVMWQ